MGSYFSTPQTCRVEFIYTNNTRISTQVEYDPNLQSYQTLQMHPKLSFKLNDDRSQLTLLYQAQSLVTLKVEKKEDQKKDDGHYVASLNNQETRQIPVEVFPYLQGLQQIETSNWI